jgi:phosphate transport system substrate-binding protein
MKKVARILGGLGITAMLLSTSVATAADITGAGATFPYPVYSKWADAYKTQTGIGMNYQSIGSGGGIKQIKAKTVDFGATDGPLKIEDLDFNGLTQFPTVIGGVVPVINVEGVAAGQLKLTAETLTAIFMGEITKWNDPKLAVENKGVALPDAAITVVHRSDGSGTTAIFTDYLSKVSIDWKRNVGSGGSVAWPVGTGGKGNEGVASYVQRIKNSIGYVEYAYALQNNIPYALMKNKDGNFVKPDAENFKAAAANAKWDADKGFYMMLTNQPGKDSWPITGATFILVYKSQEKADVALSTLKFFDFAFTPAGDKMASDLHYVPLPENVTKMIRDAWKAKIKSEDGKAIWK